MRASFIIALDGFYVCTWRNFQSSCKFLIDWPWSNDGLSFFFAYLSCSCHNMDLVFYQIVLSSVYHPYLVTTQQIGSNALRRKQIQQINFLQGTPVNWNAFQVTTGWENAKLSSRQRVATLKNLKSKIYFDLFNTFLVITWFHMRYFIVLMSSLLFYNVEYIQNKEKPLNE
jgi:hypothetical protein